MDTASATIDGSTSGYMADWPLPADLTPQLAEWSKIVPDFFAQYLQPDISTLPQIQIIEPVFTFNGDIIINGDMGSLTKNDLHEFRKDIIHDMYETMQKYRVKSGTY